MTLNQEAHNRNNHPETAASWLENQPRHRLPDLGGIRATEEQLAVIRCAMRDGESYGEFVSRTGLSVHQAQTMTESEIIAFCQRAEEAALTENVYVPPTPQKLPSKFTVKHLK
jgi:hypothetical protein